MTTVLQRLLKYPHAAVFDNAPGAELALRVRHAGGAVWVIADEVMTVTAGALERSYSLVDFTVGTLAAALSTDGFEVPTIAQEWQHRSALVLAEGRGDQGESNGDHIHAFTSLLWVLLSGYVIEVREAEYQVGQALRQMSITTAEGEWLDLWGTLYGVPRLLGELDPAYVPRIEKEVFRIRVSVGGIEQAILDATGWDVRIQEPWKEVFTLDQSTLSGPDRIYDGAHYGYHLIRPFTRDTVDWPAVLAVIDRNRSAGVLVVDAETQRGGISTYAGATVDSGVLSQHLRLQVYEDRALLDYSTIEELSILNHASRHRREVIRTSGSEIGTIEWNEFTWDLPGVTWGSPPYYVHVEASRDYRTYYLYAEYAGQYWPAGRTWATIDATWANYNVVIYSGHTRLS